jgi:hypothetical protein
MPGESRALVSPPTCFGLSAPGQRNWNRTCACTAARGRTNSRADRNSVATTGYAHPIWPHSGCCCCPADCGIGNLYTGLSRVVVFCPHCHSIQTSCTRYLLAHRHCRAAGHQQHTLNRSPLCTWRKRRHCFGFTYGVAVADRLSSHWIFSYRRARGKPNGSGSTAGGLPLRAALEFPVASTPVMRDMS